MPLSRPTGVLSHIALIIHLRCHIPFNPVHTEQLIQFIN